MIGVTGGIATGKSTVTSRLRELGAVVLDADHIAHEVIAPHTPGWLEVSQRFPGVVQPDGSIDRKKLGSIVFAKPTLRRVLEDITHPRVIRHLQTHGRMAEQAGEIVVCDIPLLFETNSNEWLEEVWVVYTDSETQLRRLMLRDGLNLDQARQRIEAQMPLAEKMKRADHVIDNSNSRCETIRQVDALWEQIKR